jgi:phosphoenolpyruvate phosphomutase
MKAIIIAAGPGKRLGNHTYDKPKGLLKVGDKTILETQMEALRHHNVNDIVIVRGHMKERINFPDVKYCENNDYLNNNILQSLFCAESEINGAFVFSYSDILYDKEIVRKLLEQKVDIELIVDVGWKKRYENRTLHPPSEAELVFVKDGFITKIAKGLDPDKSHGEFIGLAFFSEKGAKTLKTVFREVNKKFQNKQFHNAVTIQKAYLTDMLQELIDRGHKVKNIDIDGGWHEIDTPQDLERAVREWKVN